MSGAGIGRGRIDTTTAQRFGRELGEQAASRRR